jgi:hypothetical protein
LTASQPANIAIDFNVASSLVAATVGTTNTFSVDPSVTVTDNTTALADGNLLDVAPITGTVTTVGSGSLTLTDSTTGQPVTIAVNTGTNPTTFNGFGSCMGADLSCVQANQVVTVNSTIATSSPLTQTATSVTDNGGIAFGQGFEGTVIQTGATPMVLVTSVPAGNTQNVAVGQTLAVTLPATSAGFSVATPAGQTLPAGVSFAGAGDLVNGQNVLVDSTGVVTAGGVSTSTADQVVLEPTQFNGTVSALNSPNFTVNGLNNFFTDNNIPSVNFETGTQTTFGGTATDFSGLTVGDQTSMNGFLFNGGVGQPPAIFGENVIDGGQPQAAARKAK